MTGHRKRYSADLKAKVALEAIRGQKTTNEIATEYGVHPTQITQWKKQALEELPQIFSSRREQAEQRASSDALRCGVVISRTSACREGLSI